MNTIPSQDIKRKGISAVDEALKDGPVHVIKNNRPQYVVLSEEGYLALVDAQQDAYLARLKTALEDVKSKRVKRFSNVEDLLTELAKPE